MNWRSGIIFVVALASYAWAVFTPVEVLTNDGPQHTFAAFVSAHIEDPPWSGVYRTNRATTSNGVHQVLVALEPVFGMDLAMRLALLGMLALWGGAWSTWLRQNLGPSSPLPDLSYIWALQWAVFIGLWPFFIATAFIPLYFALVVGSRRHVTAAAGVLLGIAWIHISAAALAGLLGVVISLVTLERLRSGLRAVVAGVPAGLYAVIASTSTSETLPSRATAWVTLASDPVGFMFPGPGWHVAVMLAAGGWAVLLRQRPALTAAGLMGLLVATLLPLDIGAWQLVSPRLVPIAFMMVLAGARDLPRFINGPFTLMLVVVIAGRGWWAGQVWQKATHEAPPAAIFKGLALPGQHWTLLILRSDVVRPFHPVAGFQPSLHYAQVRAPQIGGAPYFSHHGLPGVHHIIRTTSPVSPWLGPVSSLGWQQLTWDPRVPRGDRSGFVNMKLAELAFIGNIVVYGYPGDEEDALAAGFGVEVKWRDADSVLFVARLESPCIYELSAPGAPAATAIFGFGAGSNGHVRDAAILGSTPWQVSAPCVGVWFVVDVPCAEADADGIIVVEPGMPKQVTCTPSVRAPK